MGKIAVRGVVGDGSKSRLSLILCSPMLLHEVSHVHFQHSATLKLFVAFSPALSVTNRIEAWLPSGFISSRVRDDAVGRWLPPGRSHQRIVQLVGRQIAIGGSIVMVNRPIPQPKCYLN